MKSGIEERLTPPTRIRRRPRQNPNDIPRLIPIIVLEHIIRNRSRRILYTRCLSRQQSFSPLFHQTPIPIPFLLHHHNPRSRREHTSTTQININPSSGHHPTPNKHRRRSARNERRKHCSVLFCSVRASCVCGRRVLIPVRSVRRSLVSYRLRLKSLAHRTWERNEWTSGTKPCLDGSSSLFYSLDRSLARSSMSSS